MRSQNILIGAAAVAAAVAGFWFANGDQLTDQSRDSANSPIQGFVLSTPRKLGIPELSQGDGSVFDGSDLEGKWSLLFYGYTNCPDICPTTLNTVAAAHKQAQQENVAFPQVVFVSVDPNRDSAKMVGEYVRYFDESFIGVTGEARMLDAMAKQMSVVAMASPAEKSGEYLVDHSSNLLLLDPQVRLVAMLKPPHSVETILKAIRTIAVGD